MVDPAEIHLYRLASYRLDGTDPQPYINVHHDLRSFDIAPTLTPRC